MAGKMIAARPATIARTHTISRRVNPSSPEPSSACPADNICRRTGSPFYPVRAVGYDVERPVLARRTVDIGMAPRIVGNGAGSQIRAIPRLDTARLVRQRGEALGRRWISSDVEIVEDERAGKALDLSLG